MSRRKQSNPKSLKNDTDNLSTATMEGNEWDNKQEKRSKLSRQSQLDVSVTSQSPQLADSPHESISSESHISPNDLRVECVKSPSKEGTSAECPMKKEVTTPSPCNSPNAFAATNPLLTPTSLADAVFASSSLGQSLLKSHLEASTCSTLSNLLQHIPLLSSVLPALQRLSPGGLPGLTAGLGGGITCVCGVKFNSTSNLEAHRAFYCSHRQGDSNAERKEDNESPPKTDEEETSSGRMLKCPHCPYTTTHKLSLNGHMNIHTSPDETGLVKTPFPPLMDARVPDRYCTDCDIQFSSTKTFRVHKAHYCDTRHVLKGSKSPGRDEGPIAGISGLNSCTANGSNGPQPVLALPTNPVLLVPYSLVAGAQLLPHHFLPQSGAAFVFANGQVHPLPSAASHLNSTVLPPMLSPDTPMDITPPRVSPVTSQRKPDEPSHSKRKPDRVETKKPDNGKRRIEADSPLDLTTKRHKLSVKSNLMSDEEKENRQLNGSSLEEKLPGLRLTGEFEGKLLSSPQISPHTDRDETRDKSPRVVPTAAPSTSPRGSGSSPRPSTSTVSSPVSPTKSPSANSQPTLPTLLAGFPNHMLSTLESLGSSLPLASLQCLQNLQNVPRDLALKLMSPENLMNGLSPVISPPVLVKQGEAKCNECNIVFYKEESLQVHKKHYCSARDASKASEEERPTSTSRSPQPTTSSDTSAHKSPVREPTASAKECPKSAKSLLQFICTACGIRFSSPDNLAAHQTYYCPKREGASEEGVHKGLWRCPRCKVVMAETMQAAHQCVTPTPTPSHGWKCPCCPVLSPTATAAQKHLETHAGIRAFRCTICGYRGNTLRGMRTHIRMHFEKRTNDLQEENFIACILEEDEHRGRGMSSDARKLMDSSRLLLENPALSTLLNDGNLPDQVEPPLSCTYCSFSSTARSALIQHLVFAHKMGSDGKAVQDWKVLLECRQTDENSPPSSTNKNETDNKRDTSPPAAIKLEPQIKIEVHEPEAISPQVLSDPETTSPKPSVSIHSVPNGSPRNGVCFCQICNIEFSRLDSYIAHKRFYCTRPQSTTPPETTVQ